MYILYVYIKIKKQKLQKSTTFPQLHPILFLSKQ